MTFSLSAVSVDYDTTKRGGGVEIDSHVSEIMTDVASFLHRVEMGG